MESSTVAPNCYGCFTTHTPSACPFVGAYYNKASLINANIPSTFGANVPSWPSTFGANAASWCPSPFAANWPSTFGANVPSWPSTFGANAASWCPSPFGANVPSWMNNIWGEKTWARNMLPSEVRDVAFRPASMAEYWSLSNPIHFHPVDGSRMLHLCFDVKGFKPEEINVSVNVKERCFTVECKYDVKEKEHTATRTYTRKFTLPAEYCCDLSKVEKELKSCVTADGLLVIEALLPRMTPEEIKIFKEKCPSKALSTGICESAGHFHGALACSIPIKTVA